MKYQFVKCDVCEKYIEAGVNSCEFCGQSTDKAIRDSQRNYRMEMAAKREGDIRRERIEKDADAAREIAAMSGIPADKIIVATVG